ncbi:MAG: ABC transporter ATP-binding protein [Coriobacteriia bacterium]|nr:ABC transporter ATP-binding protein [Coriobacteriia bacterium]
MSVLALREITKSFPGVLANERVSMTVERGEIVALLGENGAGKSTLMNAVYGLITPDSGEVLVDDQRVRIRGPRQAIDLGIGMVHQHFMLVEPLTVTENIVLGREPAKYGVLDVATARTRVNELSERYGLKVEPDAPIRDLSVGMQQRVEILKALYQGARILILDEPTAVLTPQEVRELFGVIRSLVDGGLSVVLITHKLEEVMLIADRVIVMRGGRVVGETRPADTDMAGLARMMVGREVVFRIEKKPVVCGDTVLKVENLKVRDERRLEAVRDVSFDVCAGEIVAIAGVSGNGQTELVEALTGLRAPESGSIELLDRDITHAKPRQTIRAGLSHVPEDRRRRGLVLEFDLTENVMLGDQREQPFSRYGVLNRPIMSSVAEKRVHDYDVRTPGIRLLAGNLSGGNQQKLILARELGRNPTMIIAAQPTRGLDVGAIEFVHGRILEEREGGKAVLLVSLELEEVLTLADRILVMYEGRIVAEFSAEEADEETIGLYMTGGGARKLESSPAGADSDSSPSANGASPSPEGADA